MRLMRHALSTRPLHVRSLVCVGEQGFVMPFCIERHTVIAARPTAGPRCRVVSSNAGDGLVSEFAADGSLSPAPAGDWTNYMCVRRPAALSCASC